MTQRRHANDTNIGDLMFSAKTSKPVQQSLGFPFKQLSGYITAKPDNADKKILKIPVPQDIVEEYRKNYIKALSSYKCKDKKEFIDYFNQYVAPNLHTEEAYLEIVTSHLVYLFLPVGTVIGCHIKNNLQGESVKSYPSYLRLEEKLVERQEGGVFQLWVPHDWWSRKLKKRSLLLARGTALFRSDPLADRYKYPKGHRSDFDLKGVGWRAYDACKAKLKKWVDLAQRHSKHTTFAGHSLGGALIATAYADQPEEKRKFFRLLTFHAPGIAREDAAKIRPHDDARLVRHSYDFIPKSGPAQPWVKIILHKNRDLEGEYSPHTAALLAMQQLLNKKIEYEVRQGFWYDYYTPLEGLRWFIGVVIGRFLLP